MNHFKVTIMKLRVLCKAEEHLEQLFDKQFPWKNSAP
jgi:hypothetical protein